MNWDFSQSDPVPPAGSPTPARRWLLLAACVALGCGGSPGPTPYLNEAGEFWAEGYWRFDPGQSYELTEARLGEAAKAENAEVDDARLKDAFWLLSHTEGEMYLSAYAKADLRLTWRAGTGEGSDTETVSGTWRPRAGGMELDVEYPASAAGQQFFFERENDYRLRIKRGDVWHVWSFSRSRR